jgi:hypothetical protein
LLLDCYCECPRFLRGKENLGVRRAQEYSDGFFWISHLYQAQKPSSLCPSEALPIFPWSLPALAGLRSSHLYPQVLPLRAALKYPCAILSVTNIVMTTSCSLCLFIIQLTQPFQPRELSLGLFYFLTLLCAAAIPLNLIRPSHMSPLLDYGTNLTCLSGPAPSNINSTPYRLYDLWGNGRISNE